MISKRTGPNQQPSRSGFGELVAPKPTPAIEVITRLAKRLEAENAALKERIKELEAELTKALNG